MTIKNYNKNIKFLLPKRLKDYVNPDDNCLLVEKIVESMKNTKIAEEKKKNIFKKSYFLNHNKLLPKNKNTLKIIINGKAVGCIGTPT